MEASVNQCRHLLSIAERTLKDLDDSHLALEPRPGLKTAGWLVGHLAVTGDFGRRLCGRKALCPKEWRDRYNPGSQPSPRREDYASMAEMRDALRSVYRDFADAALAADPASLAAPNPYEPTRPAFPTAGSFATYLLAGHFSYHLGQLVAWRAAAGLRPSGAE